MVEALWSSDEIAAACRGQSYGPPFLASGVSIDSRTLEPGDLFVALQGARDGEAFLETAEARGAAGVLTRRRRGRAGVEVADALAALGDLGRAARTRAKRARICAVTGSVGKTSATQALAAALRPSGRVHAPVKSFNNHIGVPLTLARMPPAVDFAVFELGMNHAGEIAPLSQLVRPKVCLVTTVGAAHVENFADGEAGVARAKAEIFTGAEPGGVAILNADNPWFALLSSAAADAGLKVWSFGTAPSASARLTALRPEGDGQRLEAEILGEPLRLSLRVQGAHWGLNALGVLLACEALGASRPAAEAALSRVSALPGRGEISTLSLAGGPARLIDESYNANPMSMAAALRTLALAPAAGRRIAVLTDMLELGPDAEAAHRDLAPALAEAGVDLVFTAGPLMQALFEALPQERKGAWRGQAEEILGEVLSAIRAGDVILVKGSNGSRAGRIVETLKAQFGAGG